MDPIYDSPLNPFGIEQEIEIYERYSLKELRDKEKWIENLLRKKQADEPSRKRKNKNAVQFLGAKHRGMDRRTTAVEGRD